MCGVCDGTHGRAERASATGQERSGAVKRRRGAGSGHLRACERARTLHSTSAPADLKYSSCEQIHGNHLEIQLSWGIKKTCYKIKLTSTTY